MYVFRHIIWRFACLFVSLLSQMQLKYEQSEIRLAGWVERRGSLDGVVLPRVQRLEELLRLAYTSQRVLPQFLGRRFLLHSFRLRDGLCLR